MSLEQLERKSPKKSINPSRFPRELLGRPCYCFQVRGLQWRPHGSWNWITSVVGGAHYRYLPCRCSLVFLDCHMQLQQMAGKLGRPSEIWPKNNSDAFARGSAYS